jgi:hypothetical protein
MERNQLLVEDVSQVEPQLADETSTLRKKRERSEFPKRGKTRMPARLVSKRAIIDLGYPFEEEVRTPYIISITTC